MPTVVGVRLRFAGKVLDFDPAGTQPVEGDDVIVDTERGQEYGSVAYGPREVSEEELSAPLKPVIRIATPEDRARQEALRSQEAEEFRLFRELVDKHGLEMKPIGVEHLFDDSKVVFYFVAEERVDFRELVRDLASELHRRVDMRQIGVRDEARMVGGIGHCGQQLCCVRFGGDFQPVSIRMAKEQDLPLNPLKISGLCGRLMCCLRYEYDAYKEFKQRSPKCGTQVDFSDGTFGKITAVNVPTETFTIRQQGGQEVRVPLEALDCSAGRGCPCKLDVQVLEERKSVVSFTHGTLPSLRDAERSGESVEAAPGRKPRKRQSARSSAKGAAAETPKKGNDKRIEGDAAAGAAPAAGTSTRRPRRRRRRPGGEAATKQ